MKYIRNLHRRPGETGGMSLRRLGGTLLNMSLRAVHLFIVGFQGALRSPGAEYRVPDCKGNDYLLDFPGKIPVSLLIW